MAHAASEKLNIKFGVHLQISLQAHTKYMHAYITSKLI